MTSHLRARYLVPGCTLPDDATLEAFYAAAKAARPDLGLPDDFQVRWIGSDETTTRNILQHIHSGDKSGTVSVPWVLERTGQPRLHAGEALLLINFDGTPAVVLRITRVEDVPYGDIDERHTALDGPRVRALDIWKPLHLRFFDMLLAPYGLKTDDETPITFETFERVYP